MSLPYIERYDDASDGARARELIAQETAADTPDDVALKVQHLLHTALGPPPTPPFAHRPLLRAEYDRVCERRPMPKLDEARYRLDHPPESSQHEPAAWERAISNARAQLEHQYTRLENLALLSEGGAEVWRGSLEGLEAIAARLTQEHHKVRDAVNELNRKRKRVQGGVEPVLARRGAEWLNGARKNAFLEAECARLEHECTQLRDRLR